MTISIPIKHILLGLTIRELLAPWTGHLYDFEIWTRLGFYMQTLSSPYRTLSYVPGLSFSPFPTTGSIGYPPLSAFMFGLAYRLYVLLGEPTRFLYYFLLKQPIVFADVGIAIVIARILFLTGNSRSAYAGLMIWLYFPFGIIISSIWGQIDPISLFLSLLATYYFLASRHMRSALTLGLSIWLKTLPVIFLAVFLAQSRVARGIRLRYLLASLSIPLAGTLIPAILLNWRIDGIYSTLASQAAVPINGEMSLLAVFDYLPVVSGLARYFTPYLWVPVLLVVYVYIRRFKPDLLQGLLITALAFPISRPWLSEQHAIYPLALLLVTNKGEGMRYFLGLAFASTLFLVANFTLLVSFFTPLFPWAFEWNQFPWKIFVISPPWYAGLRAGAMSIAVVLYFVVSTSAILGGGALEFARPVWTLRGAKNLPWRHRPP